MGNQIEKMTSQPSVEELLARRTKSLVGKTVQGVLTVLDKKPIAFIKWNDKRNDNIFVKLDNVDVPLDFGESAVVKCTIAGLGKGKSWDSKYPFTRSIEIIRRIPKSEPRFRPHVKSVSAQRRFKSNSPVRSQNRGSWRRPVSRPVVG